jgi:hypothetical protein
MARYYKETIGSYGETAPAPISQTTNQIPTPPVTADTDTTTDGANPIEQSGEMPTEISIPAEQAPLDSDEPVQDTTEPVQGTTNTINEANVPNG